MPRPKEPIELIKAKEKSHYSKKDLGEREEAEARPSEPIKQLRAPDWLPKSLRPQFKKVADQVLDMLPNTVARTDAESIAKWCVTSAQWLEATKYLQDALNEGDVDEAGKWSVIQAKTFNQAERLGKDLGLTISGRCQLIVPKAKTKEDENPFLKMMGRASND